MDNDKSRASLWITSDGPDAPKANARLRVYAKRSLGVVSARRYSPCGSKWVERRDIFRPARQKCLDFGDFGLAGRVLSRFGRGWVVAGRTFSRGNGWRGLLGEFCLGVAVRGLLLGEFCRGWAGQVGVDGVMRASCYAGALVCSFRIESARNSSPCRVKWFGKREKVRPARQKWLDFGDFGLAGRVLSRFGRGWVVAGRVFSRFGLERAVAGRTYSRGNGWRGFLGEFFRGLAWKGLLLGELFRALEPSGRNICPGTMSATPAISR